MDQPVVKSPQESFEHVIGVGSSAGGLEALQDLVGSLVANGKSTYVVAQHLAPDHRSLIVDLLGRATSLKVIKAIDGAPLEADVIVVAPPKHDVAVVGGLLRVSDPVTRYGPSPNIDLLFESIAEHWGARGVAVVLSGTGSDGANGLRAVHAAGGLTVVQSPGSAKFDGMPRAAIALGGADLIVDATEIGQRLARLVSTGGDWIGETLPEPEPEALISVARQLKLALGIDFSDYKESTLRRQLQRRMAIRHLTTIDDYLLLLAAEPEEAEALANNLLVTVTSFFRDPLAFEALKEQLRIYLAKRPNKAPLRIWVPGCATGEEVYSLAMLISDQLGHPHDLERRLKIFGTDLNEGNLSIARRAIYPALVAESIPLELRARYVREGSSGIEIAEVLRECAVFARHNVGEDPPFPRLDLVSCRNTLIYFTSSRQERVLGLFRYGLLPGGLLFLGSSESLGSRAPGFEALDVDQRIYRRTSEPSRPLLPTISQPLARLPLPFAPVGRIAILHDDIPQQHVALLEAMVRTVANPCLVVDENLELVEVVGDVSSYCRLPEGRVNSAAGAFLQPELQGEARALLLISRAEGTPIVSRPLQLAGGTIVVKLEARPLLLPGTDLTVLSFLRQQGAWSEVAPEVEERPAGFDAELERLERELLASQNSLRRSLAELEAANEELEASTEELQASAEELQSSNEELQSSNEELQATNEELATLNQQLRSHGEELDLLFQDQSVILSALNQGMVIVDGELRVTRFSPLAVRLFALVENDIGQPLLDLPTTVPIPGLVEALKAVISGEPRRNLEAYGNNLSYMVQVLPFRSRGGRSKGAIVTLTDVSELVELRRVAERALAEFSRLTDALEEAVWKRDLGMENLLYASERMQALTGWSSSELQEKPERLNEAIDPADLARVLSVRAESPHGWTLRYRLRTRAGAVIWVSESAVVVNTENDHYVVGTLADVSERRTLEEKAKEMSGIFESVFHTKVFGIAVLDSQFRVVMANETLCSLVGFDPDSIVGLPSDIFTAQDSTGSENSFVGPRPTPSVKVEPGILSNLVPRSLQLRNLEGRSVWVMADTLILPQPIGEATALVVVQDVTAMRESTDLLERQARLDDVTGLMNRSTFSDALEREIARSERQGTSLAMAWIDLDKFKEVNDQYGHDTGDAVLRSTADRLNSVVRSQDMVGRLGGDEFGILVSGYERISALESMLERLVASLQEPMCISEIEFKVGSSVGVAIYPDDANEIKALMRSADAAMYAVKSSGGNSYAFFTSSLNDAADQRRYLRRALTSALKSEDFELFYQPIVATEGGAVWGAEALMRWHRDGATVQAQEFIEFIEESGLIRQLGPLTLRLLRKDLEKLRSAGYPTLPVSLNLSVRQLEDPSFIEQISNCADSNGLSGIVIEVAEAILMPNHGHALEVLGNMSRLGARISIDNYGSGYSNLRELQSLEPSYLKIDRSLLEGCREGGKGRQVLRSTIEMAHAFGSTVVAEGVESEAMRQLATDLGANLVQGYEIGRPMPLDEFLSWLDARPNSGP